MLFRRGEGVDPFDEIVALFLSPFEGERACRALHPERVDQEVVQGVGCRQGCAEGLVLRVHELNDIRGAALIEVGDELQVSRRGLGGVPGEGDVSLRGARRVQGGAAALLESLRDDGAVGL